MAETKMTKSESHRSLPSLSRDLFHNPFGMFGKPLGFDPFGMMWDLPAEMKRFFSGYDVEGETPKVWMPILEMKQSKGMLTISAVLPGIKREDIKLGTTDQVLTMEGERTRGEKEEKKDLYRCERRS